MRRSRVARQDELDINMTPLIDMVFILLIFFIVTTSFVRETGVDVERPEAATAESRENASLLLGVAADGRVFLEGEEIDIRNVQARMERFLADEPAGSVVIIADKTCPTGITVQVLDFCRLAGVGNVSVAAKRE